MASVYLRDTHNIRIYALIYQKRNTGELFLPTI